MVSEVSKLTKIIVFSPVVNVMKKKILISLVTFLSQNQKVCAHEKKTN